MANGELENLTRRVMSDLERYAGRRRKARREVTEDLLVLLMTAGVPARLEDVVESSEVRGFRTHVAALRDHLQQYSFLPEALCARYRYNLSEGRARRLYRVRPRAWDFFHELAERIGWDPSLQAERITYEDFAWHDALEERFVAVEVVLDTPALEGMLVTTMEGFLSPRSSHRKGYEVYGLNLGMTRNVVHKPSRGGVRRTRYVSVMRSQPQLSANGEYRFVEPNPRSLDAIMTATQSLYPQFQAVGDFHSHPYDEFSEMIERRGWDYSPSDEEGNIDFAQVMSELGHRIQVSFVVAIVRSKPVARSHFRGMRNTIQLWLGGCRIIVAAYRSLGSGRLARSNIRLSLSGMVS